MKAAIAEGLVTPSRRDLRAGRHVFWLRGDYTLKNSELIFAAVSRIANSLAAMPVTLYKGSKKVEGELNDLIGFAPNPSMTSATFFRTMEACRNTYGNCYALKIYDHNGELERLDVLDPARVEPIMETESMELWYRVTPRDGKEQMYIHNYYMIHVPFISTNGYKGISPIAVLQDTLEYAELVQKFSRDQMQDGVNAKIVLEAPANLGKEQQKQVIEDFREVYSETAGGILFLESGVQAKTLNMSPIDSKIFEVEKISRSKVAMVYNIPPHLMGDYSDTSYNSQEQQMLEFLQLTMLIVVRSWEQELDKKILTMEQRQQGYHFVFNMEEILRADAATRAEVNQKSIRGGWCTVNEVRKSYNMAPLPTEVGDTAMISRDLAPLAWLIQHPNGTDKMPANDNTPKSASEGDAA